MTVDVGEKEAHFPLQLRIPAWADGAGVTVAGQPTAPARPGSYERVERTWKGRTAVTLRLPMPVRVRRGYHDSAALEAGPLVFALKIGAQWKRLKGQLPFADWEVHPTTPWNYALALDLEHPERSVRAEHRAMGQQPFSPEEAPVLLHARGRRLPQWTLVKHAAGPLPVSPVTSQQPLEDLVLIPYGCTSLRVTEFPVLARRGQ